MFTLLRLLPARRLLLEQAPIVLVAFLIAETFYKFHSFTLETLAFLATWLVGDAVVQGVARVVAALARRARPTP